MKYRSVAIGKKNITTNFILIYSFIAIISISILLLIHTNSQVEVLKTIEIPALKKRLNTTKNSIAVENRNNSNLIRKFIKIRAEELGMIKADYSNIIDVWWNKENN